MSRYRLATSGEWEVGSLVGSHFLGEGLQGSVVAEPSPGVYLCELLSWVDGAPTDQMLFSIDRMMKGEWTFYDTAEERNLHYEERISYQWEQKRSERKKEYE